MAWFPTLLLIVAIQVIHGENAVRDDKMFALFNVVKFKNTECQATSSATLTGKCRTSQECSDMTGTADGNCAAGFGVCCVLSVLPAGSTSENITYLESTAYPAVSTDAITTDHAYTINRCSTDVCQVRLDFTDVVLLAAAAADGTCGDILRINGGTGTASASCSTTTAASGSLPCTNPGNLCGTLTGQHLYVDAGTATAVATVTVRLLAAVTTQKWRIKASQIDCNSEWRAPQGCLQYFTTTSGTITSFNFAGAQMLQSQQYSACVRSQPGYCCIAWRESQVSGTLDMFQLSTIAADTGKTTLAICTTTLASSYVQIPATPSQTTHRNDIFCGGQFGTGGYDTAIVITAIAIPAGSGGGVVYSCQQPFRVNSFQPAATQALVTGFSLDYQLIGCGEQ
jgi:hypothetical protein